MFRNTLLVALRNLRKHSAFSAINILGLAIGLACCTFIVIYIVSERSYDRFHLNADRIVRIVEDRIEEGRIGKYATTYGVLAPTLDRTFPFVDKTVRLFKQSILVTDQDNTSYQEDEVLFVDSTFFQVFTFDLLEGSEDKAFAAPYTAVVTESISRKYFGDDNPVGQTLQIKDQDQTMVTTITGLVADPPAQSHFNFDILISFETARISMGHWIDDPNNWDHPPLYTYALLENSSDEAALERELQSFAVDVMGEARAEKRSLHIQPLLDIRLNSSKENEIGPGSDVKYIYIFGIICGLVLLIACANFVNLATARATDRLKEMGVRSSMGAHRVQLVRQLLGESVLQVGVSVLLAIAFVELLLSSYGENFGIEAGTRLFGSPEAMFTLLGVVAATVLLSGLYPALYLTSSRPTDALKGRGLSGTLSNAGVRRGLVIGQFAISVGLVLSTLAIQQQLQFIQEEKLGFDKENVILIPLRETEDQMNHVPLKDKLVSLPGVVSVAASSGMPGLNSGIYDFAIYPGSSRSDSLQMLTLTVDHDYVATFGMNIAEGRDFSTDIRSDETSAFLINESAARKLGWSDPVGKELTLGVWFDGYLMKKGEVVGVIEDFQYGSLHTTIEPLILHIFPETYYYDFLSVRLRPGDYRSSIEDISREWTSFNADRPFEYEFLDQQFDRLYRSEQLLNKLFGMFAGLAIIIASLGLIGLAAFSVAKRTKEIGVRKVLGASVSNLVTMLSIDLLTPVAIALAIGSLVSILLLQPWLQSFAYRTSPGIGVFALTALVTLGAGVVAVGYQAIRAAMQDPVESLRYE